MAEINKHLDSRIIFYTHVGWKTMREIFWWDIVCPNMSKVTFPVKLS